jgi:integrase
MNDDVNVITVEEGSQALSPYSMFKFSIRSEITRKYYERRLRKFLDFVKFKPEATDIEKRCNDFAEEAKMNPNWALNHFIRFLQYQKVRVEKGEITAGTLRNSVKSLKAFCDSADLNIPWKKVTKGLPKARQSSNDRAPTVEEIRKIVDYPDRRIKPIVYIMVSSGIRLGAWDYLKWKNVKSIPDNEGKAIAAKLDVYSGDFEEYYAFITPEAYIALKEWMDFRASYGERITGDSWVMRDLWQTTNMNYGARWGLATSPK